VEQEKGEMTRLKGRRNIKWEMNVRSVVFSLFNKCNIRR
jgi:hypothetical protein